MPDIAFDLLQFIARSTEAEGWPPSQRDIVAAKIGINSVSHANYWLRWLADNGYIKRGSGARQIALTESGRLVLWMVAA